MVLSTASPVGDDVVRRALRAADGIIDARAIDLD